MFLVWEDGIVPIMSRLAIQYGPLGGVAASNANGHPSLTSLSNVNPAPISGEIEPISFSFTERLGQNGSAQIKVREGNRPNWPIPDAAAYIVDEATGDVHFLSIPQTQDVDSKLKQVTYGMVDMRQVGYWRVLDHLAVTAGIYSTSQRPATMVSSNHWRLNATDPGGTVANYHTIGLDLINPHPDDGALVSRPVEAPISLGEIWDLLLEEGIPYKVEVVGQLEGNKMRRSVRVAKVAQDAVAYHLVDGIEINVSSAKTSWANYANSLAARQSQSTVVTEFSNPLTRLLRQKAYIPNDVNSADHLATASLLELQRRSSVKPTVEVELVPEQTTETSILQYRVGMKVGIESEQHGIDSDFYIQERTITVDGGSMKAKLGVVEAEVWEG